VLGEGKIDEARRILVNVIDNLYADQNKNGLAFALDRMAHIFVITNSPEATAHLIVGQTRTVGYLVPRIEQVDIDRDIAAIKAKIGDNIYETTYNIGQALTLDEVVSFAASGK
jgi:hypothetical protein